MRSAFAPTLTICPPELRPTLRAMLDELDYMHLQVDLIPAPEPQHQGHFVRAVFGRNPSWYRDLCAAFPRHRRTRKERYVDPRFKREAVTTALQRLLSTGSRSYLAGPLLDEAHRQHTEAPVLPAYNSGPGWIMRDPAAWPYDLPADAAAMGVAI